ncbi:DUF2860 family protein [Psychromonas ossibalaenae]|uniref:DUF2860 family protein n=1 Tax=Psychromonas ossibalaenae TaxID=444922 RepID=UPI000362E366|nr:DUF2860 family protein [Psychromonas ossibalaenae]
MLKQLFPAALLVFTMNTYASDVTAIPQQSGWDGFLMGGLGNTQFSSNFVSGTQMNSLSSAETDSLYNSPHTESSFAVQYNFDIRYTFAHSGTQIVLGNLMQDALRLDFSQQLGIRQKVNNEGIVSVSYLFSGMPSEVWADPYQTDAQRSSTEKSANGVRLGWEQVWATPLTLTYTRREQSLTEESSGRSLDLTANEQQSLDRNGTINSLEGAYRWRLQNNQQLTGALIWENYDLQGDAMSRTRIGGQLTHSLSTQNYTIVSNLYAGALLYDENNPVYDTKTDTAETAVNVSLFRHNLFGVNSLSGLAAVLWGQSNSQEDFFDSTITRVSVGVVYKF